jgi:hypothetical protein
MSVMNLYFVVADLHAVLFTIAVYRQPYPTFMSGVLGVFSVVALAVAWPLVDLGIVVRLVRRWWRA